jgi:hypothetical protein
VYWLALGQPGALEVLPAVRRDDRRGPLANAVRHTGTPTRGLLKHHGTASCSDGERLLQVRIPRDELLRGLRFERSRVQCRALPPLGEVLGELGAGTWGRDEPQDVVDDVGRPSDGLAIRFGRRLSNSPVTTE